MALKDLMVHLDPGERTATRLAFAVDLARAHDARLVGVFGQRALAEQVGVVATWPSPEYVAAAAASKAAFEAATAGLRDAEWRDINRGSDSELLRLITEAARYADLVIVGQHDETREAPVPPELAEELVIHSGRPVLVIPYAGEFQHVGPAPADRVGQFPRIGACAQRRPAVDRGLRRGDCRVARHAVRGSGEVVRRSRPPSGLPRDQGAGPKCCWPRTSTSWTSS